MDSKLFDEVLARFTDFWCELDSNGRNIQNWAASYITSHQLSRADLIALYMAGASHNQQSLERAWREAVDLFIIRNSGT